VDTDDHVVAELLPLLGHDEKVVRCAACERRFVAQGASAPRDGGRGKHYCSLAACQLKARSGRAR
jgi:hypothetical protein